MIGCLAAVFECLPVSEVAWSQSLFKMVKPFPASSFPLELKGFSFYLGRHLCPLQRSEAPACRGCGGGWKSVAYCCRWQAPILELVSGKEKTGRHQNLRNGIRRTYTCCTPYVFSGVVSKPGCPLWSSEGFCLLFLKITWWFSQNLEAGFIKQDLGVSQSRQAPSCFLSQVMLRPTGKEQPCIQSCVNILLLQAMKGQKKTLRHQKACCCLLWNININTYWALEIFFI